jgi:hypothetical protein
MYGLRSMPEKGEKQMRVLRTILGMLLLTIGLPALLVGAGFWAAMQHRDAGGAFSGTMQRVATSGYAVVADDLDGLLREDAPFARIGDTRLRITASTPDGPAFVGIAPAAQVAAYLADVPMQNVRSIDLGTGALPMVTSRISGSRAPAVVPDELTIWWKSGTGQLDWNPSDLRGSGYSLVIMSPTARPGLELHTTAEIRPRWLNSTTWALLILGSLVVLAGMIMLAWPGRRREIVYVVEPSQVPDLIKAIGAPLPQSRRPGGRHAGMHRPRTLADSASKSSVPAPSQFAWPPPSPAVSSSRGTTAIPLPGPPTPSEYAVATAIPKPTESISGGRAPGAGEWTPAPGEPLRLMDDESGALSSSAFGRAGSRGLSVPAGSSAPSAPLGPMSSAGVGGASAAADPSSPTDSSDGSPARAFSGAGRSKGSPGVVESSDVDGSLASMGSAWAAGASSSRRVANSSASLGSASSSDPAALSRAGASSGTGTSPADAASSSDAASSAGTFSSGGAALPGSRARSGGAALSGGATFPAAGAAVSGPGSPAVGVTGGGAVSAGVGVTAGGAASSGVGVTAGGATSSGSEASPGGGVSPGDPTSGGLGGASSASTEPQLGRSSDRASRRRAAASAANEPAFEASAVGAWVAQTAAARTRETAARAAAVVAAEASRTASSQRKPTDRGVRGAPSGAAGVDSRAGLNSPAGSVGVGGPADPADVSVPANLSGSADPGGPVGLSGPADVSVPANLSSSADLGGVAAADPSRRSLLPVADSREPAASTDSSVAAASASTMLPGAGPEGTAAMASGTAASEVTGRVAGQSGSPIGSALSVRPATPTQGSSAATSGITAWTARPTTTGSRPGGPAVSGAAPYRTSAGTLAPTPGKREKSTLGETKPSDIVFAGTEPPERAGVEPSESESANAAAAQTEPAKNAQLGIGFLQTGGKTIEPVAAQPTTADLNSAEAGPSASRFEQVGIDDAKAQPDQLAAAMLTQADKPGSPKTRDPADSATESARTQTPPPDPAPIRPETITRAPSATPPARTTESAFASPDGQDQPTTTPNRANVSTRIGVAGRRDYPAPAKRDNLPPAIARPTEVAPAAAKPASVAPPTATKPADVPTTAERQADFAPTAADPAGIPSTAGHRADTAPTATGPADTTQAPTRTNGMGAETTTTTDLGQERAPRAETHIAEQRVKTASTEAKPPTKPGNPRTADSDGPSVPGARHSDYAEEAAELLAGISQNRRRKTASGLPPGDPAMAEQPIKVTRLPRKGQSKPKG